MIEYGAPPNLWEYAVEYICHTINCTRVPARNDKTAHELIHGLKPDVSKFVPLSLMILILGYWRQFGIITLLLFKNRAQEKESTTVEIRMIWVI